MKNIPPAIVEKAFEHLAGHLQAEGLRIEDHLRVSDEGMALTHQAAAAMKKTGFPFAVPSNRSIKGMGIPRDGSFLHPLSESTPEAECGVEGGAMNLWYSASVFVSVAMGWMESDDPTKALGIVKETVSSASPTTSAKKLIEAARYSDPSLLKLIGLVKDGLEIAFGKAFNK